MNSYIIAYPDELNHYGVKGMRWGVRKQLPLVSGNRRNQSGSTQDIYQRRQQRRARAKKVAKVGGAIALAALASYGAYKLSKNPQALQKGKDFLNYKILKKSKPLTTAELNKMGISTFEPAMIKLNEINVSSKPARNIKPGPSAGLAKDRFGDSINRVQSPKLTNASKRTLTKYGATSESAISYHEKADRLSKDIATKKSSDVISDAARKRSLDVKGDKAADIRNQMQRNAITTGKMPKYYSNNTPAPIKPSVKTTSTPVKDASKQLKKYYGNLDPVKDDYYDFMDEVLKGFR